MCPGNFIAVIAALYNAFWVEKKAVQTPEVYLDLIRHTAGEGIAARVGAEVRIGLPVCFYGAGDCCFPMYLLLTVKIKATGDEVKNRLSSNTSEALNDGACGLPWMKATTIDGRSESFWGCDHLEQLANFLELPKSSINARL